MDITALTFNRMGTGGRSIFGLLSRRTFISAKWGESACALFRLGSDNVKPLTCNTALESDEDFADVRVFEPIFRVPQLFNCVVVDGVFSSSTIIFDTQFYVCRKHIFSVRVSFDSNHCQFTRLLQNCDSIFIKNTWRAPCPRNHQIYDPSRWVI
jgi:hypothetical protein